MTSQPPRITMYRDNELQWRWRLERSGRIMADSGQGYTRPGDCRHGADVVTDYQSRGLELVVDKTLPPAPVGYWASCVKRGNTCTNPDHNTKHGPA